MKIAVLYCRGKLGLVFRGKRDQAHMPALQCDGLNEIGKHRADYPLLWGVGDARLQQTCGVLPGASYGAETTMTKALLCDIDGTLVQSNWLHAQAWKDAFAAMDLDVDLETARKQIGKGGDELIPVFVPWWKRPAVEEPLKTYRKFVFQHGLRQQVKPIEGVRDLLLRVKSAGIKIAVATSSGKEDLKVLLGMAGIDDLMDQTTTADDADQAKPNPDIFEAALSKLGLKPTECLALGDTPYDAESAGKAGIRTIGVMTGGWSRQELLDAGCVEVYESAADLLVHFEDSALVRTGLRIG